MSKLSETLGIAIVEILVRLDPEERVEVLGEIRHNDVFCAACGYGSPEHPNRHCQCENDE